MEIIQVIISSIVLCLALFLAFRKDKKSNAEVNIESFKKEMKEEFIQSRREMREVNQENRQEINSLFQNLQTAVVDRIKESLDLQKEQLSAFSESLDKFKKELAQSTNQAHESINTKQVEFTDKTSLKLNEFGEKLVQEGKENRTEIASGLKTSKEELTATLNTFKESLRQNFEDQNKQQHTSHKLAIDGIKEVKSAVEKQLVDIRKDNEKQLNEMRNTVDEKLQSTLEKRLGESFKQVSERLELVHKGLGEMQTIATGVGDLKKVLSNVKTRGVLGEYQLGNILEQILTPDQYAQNVATKKGSQANVEYAIKLPGKDTDEEVWMPIDSKFPIENYQLLLDAYEVGEPNEIAAAQKVLIKTIESFAKDISGKYIDPPHTTDFGIMFLPVESLYAEVLRHPGLFETLQNKYRITITGPTTLSALLNSLQMGFRTLAVQKRSSEVWKVLSAVKTEFGKFSNQLTIVQKQLNTASGSLEKLQTTRSNQIERKLKSIETMDGDEANEVLAISDNKE
ncbi:DNA recombination protein RmuC [Saccharicrinis aurantiacus]|uniref:DNA recombination protein RmuC n=1 Tax=Saccharicrinis aurantiacus TaxID=1849719 RepID=UPI0008396292|nr:DNA recombination protein RmuC [Saccharicrinis aurantiacus]